MGLHVCVGLHGNLASWIDVCDALTVGPSSARMWLCTGCVRVHSALLTGVCRPGVFMCACESVSPLARFRQYFPMAAKCHTSHDVVQVCFGCHSRANKAVSKLQARLAIEYDAPLAPADHGNEPTVCASTTASVTDSDCGPPTAAVDPWSAIPTVVRKVPGWDRGSRTCDNLLQKCHVRTGHTSDFGKHFLTPSGVVCDAPCRRPKPCCRKSTCRSLKRASMN